MCLKYFFSLLMAENNDTTFRLIKSSRGGNKLEENGFLLYKHKILCDITYFMDISLIELEISIEYMRTAKMKHSFYKILVQKREEF